MDKYEVIARSGHGDIIVTLRQEALTDTSLVYAVVLEQRGLAIIGAVEEQLDA